MRAIIKARGLSGLGRRVIPVASGELFTGQGSKRETLPCVAALEMRYGAAAHCRPPKAVVAALSPVTAADVLRQTEKAAPDSRGVSAEVSGLSLSATPSSL